MQKIKIKKTSGTFEWAGKNINYIRGCSNDCKYCYAKSMGIRFKRNTPADWENEVVRLSDLTGRIPKCNRPVMFPSAHDITPEHLSESIIMLDKILEAGNSVLIVTKPQLECISEICRSFTDYKDKIMFRFTIGSTDSNILKFWEPNASSFEERLYCLKLAYNMGYQTSISAEPLLDKNVDELIILLRRYVTDTIWIGKPNQLLARTKINGHNDTETHNRCKELMAFLDDSKFILGLYNKYQNNPMIRWKCGLWEDISRLRGMQSLGLI